MQSMGKEKRNSIEIVKQPILNRKYSMSKVIASTYELIEKIGSGGGGNVYLAYHRRLGKKVVLKADKRKISARPDLLRREVDILKELSHSYIPQVYDFFIEDETVYTVMDFIDGESLDKPLKRGERFPQSQVIKWAKQLLEALCYLHSPTHGDPPKGYVHSDIKPANIMRTPYNDICLIDFNIALALGEENVVGCSAGYASPEHYGLDYSSFGSATATIEDETVTLLDETQTLTLSNARSSSSVKKIVPDVRSDIYSVGATLYHLLSGQRPAKNAMEVAPLSDKEFSPQFVNIISKAMNPNPDLRYQTADEMLEELSHLHENDPRTKRLKKSNLIACIAISVLFLIGALTTFVGLKRMQVVESWLKLSEYSQTALDDGDSVTALNYALQALPTNKSLLRPSYIPEAQSALTEALGVYDLSDAFKKHKIAELSSNPLYMVIAPNGRTAAGVYSGFVAVFDTDSANILVTLPANKSALSEVEYLNDNVIIYAGADGIKAYDIFKNVELWSGKPSTAISISQDGKNIASVYKDEHFATIYDAETGKTKKKISFGNRGQSVTVNDSFANPNDNLFEINSDGSLLAVSFADGSLEVFDLTDSDNGIELFDNTSGYTHFEGGFFEKYLAFSATNSSSSVFAVIDTVAKEQTGGFDSTGYFGVNVDESGIYVLRDNLLVKIHPVTGEQTPLVTTSEKILHYATDNMQTMVVSNESVMFFDSNSKLITRIEEKDIGDFLCISNGVALIGSMNTPKIKIMKYENHPESEVFTYDHTYRHDEARISADGKTVMLFSYKQFRVYDINGSLIKEVDLPNADQIYDQQFIRKDNESHLEVTYNDGTLLIYNARDGNLVSEEKIDKPDLSLYEEFYTDSFRIKSPLHGSPTIHDKKTDKLICELNEDGYLTYITQVGDYIVAQYVTVDSYYYGVLLNDKCERLAYLPYLSDVMNNELYFDYPTGNMRKSRIYNINELIKMAKNELKGGN